MAKRDRKRRKSKKRCCDKPLKKACKSCPRRRPGGSLDAHSRAPEPEEPDAPACPLAAWRLA
jgi:hypothetical protein